MSLIERKFGEPDDEIEQHIRNARYGALRWEFERMVKDGIFAKTLDGGFECARSPLEKVFDEGAKSEVAQTQFERSPQARKICLQSWGYDCVVCGFNFEARYGALGKHFIHVHHLKPLSQGQRQTDAQTDLRPVCPNCHAMLHRHDPPLSIEELKRQLRPFFKPQKT